VPFKCWNGGLLYCFFSIHIKKKCRNNIIWKWWPTMAASYGHGISSSCRGWFVQILVVGYNDYFLKNKWINISLISWKLTNALILQTYLHINIEIWQPYTGAVDMWNWTRKHPHSVTRMDIAAHTCAQPPGLGA